jgi:uncharacterized surface protein with fasciclin (FAS1) repeats
MTVYAPSDAVFDKIAQDGINIFNKDPMTLSANILTGIIAKMTLPGDLKQKSYYSSLNGIYLALDGSHVNAGLQQGSILKEVSSYFNNLVNYVGLSDTVESTEGTATIFAPSDAAWTALRRILAESKIKATPQLLKELVQLHLTSPVVFNGDDDSGSSSSNLKLT